MRIFLTCSVLFALKIVQAFAWSPHKVFNKIEKISNYTTYTHRLLINYPAHIPCFESKDAPGGQASTIFWSHREFKIDKDSPFISANWDINGTLMIHHILLRKLYLWCHYQTDSARQIFVHHLEFVGSPFVQAIFAVEMNVNITEESEKVLDDFYVRQMRNCIVQSDESGTVIPEAIRGIDFEKPVIQKTAILEAVQKTCETQLDCIGVSLDFFSCYIHAGRAIGVYSIDFSTMHNVEMGMFIETNATDFGEQINQTVKRIENEVELSKGKILSVGFEKIPRTAVDLQMTIQKRIVKICLGASGRLNIEGKMECDLCPTGSASNLQITMPPPPDHRINLINGSIDEEYLSAITWPYSESPSSCQPCPNGFYSETLGQSSCLPCPRYHNTPIFENQIGSGGEWIDLACPRVGRNPIILQDFFVEANEPLGKWVEGLSEIARVWIFVGTFMGILVVVIVMTLLVYRCFDVEAMLMRSADELRPLYVEAAIVVKTAKACERERTERAIEKMRKLLQSGETAS
ncbi:unnamed protein product [Hymenolepis diminuta]|uniref:Ephrin_rec_like domain-containing protein n=2 Tax=Hymenolepis diminuta TaxID=6216 RepID=A0A0R3SQI8_HYMDI|nr:unnamed protein product [Hymenolepis diminuta]